MATYGLTSTGFNLPSLSDIISDYESDLQTGFSNDNITVEDTERLGHMVKVIAAREHKAWQAQAQTYDAWTRNGAEGTFLDEGFAFRGRYRNSATSGVGNVIVAVDETSLDSTAVDAGTEFTGNNGVTYTNTDEALASQRVIGYMLDGSSASLGTYTITITEPDDTVHTDSFTLASSTDTARLNFTTSVYTFLSEIESVNGDSNSNVQLDSDNIVCYWGFDEAYELVGLENEYTFSMEDATVGVRYFAVEAIASTTGYNPLYSGGITAMTPTPTGYISVTNIEQFSSGSDVETDAAFIERQENSVDDVVNGTRAAIRTALLDIDDVDRVYLSKTVTDGVVDVTWVVVGGTSQDIAQVLYDTQPINNYYSGDTTYSVDTEDDDTETIHFTRGTELEMAVRVTYTTKKGTALTDSEVTNIETNLTDLAEDWGLGGTIIFNSQLEAAVYSGGSSTTRFTDIIVEIKEASADDTEYVSTNYTADVASYPTLISDNITFVRSV